MTPRSVEYTPHVAGVLLVDPGPVIFETTTAGDVADVAAAGAPTAIPVVTQSAEIATAEASRLPNRVIRPP
jgi:hypothetical protein